MSSKSRLASAAGRMTHIKSVLRQDARDTAPRDASLQQQMRLILASGLFHPLWYASVARCDPDPTAAAAHYLRQLLE